MEGAVGQHDGGGEVAGHAAEGQLFRSLGGESLGGDQVLENLPALQVGQFLRHPEGPLAEGELGVHPELIGLGVETVQGAFVAGPGFHLHSVVGLQSTGDGILGGADIEGRHIQLPGDLLGLRSSSSR